MRFHITVRIFPPRRFQYSLTRFAPGSFAASSCQISCRIGGRSGSMRPFGFALPGPCRSSSPPPGPSGICRLRVFRCSFGGLRKSCGLFCGGSSGFQRMFCAPKAALRRSRSGIACSGRRFPPCCGPQRTVRSCSQPRSSRSWMWRTTWS